MKVGQLVSAGATTLAILFGVNYFIRVSGPGDESSTGYVIDYIQSHSFGTSLLFLIGVYFLIIIAQWAYYYVRGMAIPGVGQFWALVASNPDKAYQWLIESPSWRILEYPLPSNYREIVPEAEWAGPFDLYVPGIDSRISIFGRSGLYESTRNEFIQLIKAEKLKV